MTMDNYIPQPIIIREIPEHGITIAQAGAHAEVNGRPAIVTVAATIQSNPVHYLRKVLASLMPRIESGAIAALVNWEINGKPGHILITAEQWAIGAPERARYAAWLSAVEGERATRVAKERAYDLVHNEGGEGFNPHRSGSERTYAPNRRGPDPRYPAEC